MPNPTTIHFGSIEAFAGSHGSGIAFLSIRDHESGLVDRVPCDNGPLVRGLDTAFPGFITPGHRVDNSVITGQSIYWVYDNLGMFLAAIVPGVYASPELLAAYDAQLEPKEASK